MGALEGERILVRMHRIWTHGIGSIPVEPLAFDFAAMCWRLSTCEQIILQFALESLNGVGMSFGRVPYDYKPHSFADPKTQSLHEIEKRSLYRQLERALCL